MVRRGPSQALNRSFLKVNNVSDVEPWSSLLKTNTPSTLPSGHPDFPGPGNSR